MRRRGRYVPRQAANALKWNPQAQAYEILTESPNTSFPITPEDPGWVTWLGTASSFAFHSRYGHVCTIRRERVQRGDTYWYGYRRQGQKMFKRYVGRDADLTLARLETLAALLNAAEMPDALDMPSPRGKTDIVLPARHPSSRPPVASPLDRAVRSEHPEASATVTTASSPDPLLATKLRWPRPRAGLVHRGHLLDQLQQGAQQALTLISAPAGFGKTTLLAQWLATSGMPAAWLSLELSDNEPGRFLTYMIAALRTLDPQLGANTLPLLEAPQPTPLESILALLANDILARHPHDFLLVLDDYYLITAEPIQRATTFLIEHLPPQLHVVIATRADPPLPLARLRARGQLNELRAADLQFSSDETSAFLRTMSGLALPPEHLAAIERRTEGWIAGLQLAALSLQDRSDVGAFLASFTGSHRFILDYLSEEVLARQPDAVQAFLLQTSILERLSGPLCEAVTGQRDGQAMLEALDRANLFVISLDDERQWYRYHHLFADVLQRRLQQAQPALMADLHQRASAWYEQHNFAHEAVQHALAARDFEHAARLIERYAMAVFRQGQTALLVEWINALPDALVRTRPLLTMNYASALQLNDQLEEAEAHLQDAERALDGWRSAEEAGTVLGNTAVLRANSARFRGDLASYVALARTALDLVPEAEVTLRAVATMQVAHAFLVSGDVTASAEHQVYTAIAQAASSGYSRVHHRSLLMLAWLRVLQGRLRDAADIYEQAGRAAPGEQVLQVLNSSVPYFFGLGDLLREWNRLDEAERMLLQGMESISGARSTFADDMLQCYLALSRLYQARGEYGRAQAALDTFASLADARHFIPHLSAQAASALAQLDLMRGICQLPFTGRMRADSPLMRTIGAIRVSWNT